MLLDAPGLVTYFGRAGRFWIRPDLFPRTPRFFPDLLDPAPSFLKHFQPCG